MNRVMVEITFPDDFPMLDEMPRAVVVDNTDGEIIFAMLHAAPQRQLELAGKLIDFESWRTERAS